MPAPPGYLHEIWMRPDEHGQLLPACLPFGPAGDGARALNEPGSSCVFVFWANSYFEAMTFYYSFLGFGTYTTNEEWDYKPYPQDWLEEQRGYINAL
jgi:hypothetical protein